MAIAIAEAGPACSLLYNLPFWICPDMEAERINSLSNRLTDLHAREQDLRRYL